MKRHKYGVAAKPDRTCDGIVFDSKAEMIRYQELKLAVLGKAVQWMIAPTARDGIYECLTQGIITLLADRRRRRIAALSL